MPPSEPPSEPVIVPVIVVVESTCLHTTTEPAPDPTPDAALMCVACCDVLPDSWACPACQWPLDTEIPTPPVVRRFVLVSACPDHAEAVS